MDTKSRESGWDWTNACLHILFCKKSGEDCAICERIRKEVKNHPEVLEPQADGQ